MPIAPESHLAAAATAPAPPAPERRAVLGVPLAITDYERTLDWIDAAVADAPARLRLRRRRPHGDGLPRGPGAARRGARRRLHGAGRPAARLGAPRARPRAPGPRLRPRADGPRLRARRARPGSASTSTAAATTARSPSSRARCACAIPGLQIVGGHCPPFRAADRRRGGRDRATRSTAPAPTSSGSGSACPKQEKWMARMRDRLDAPVLVGVGAAFDFHAGLVPQAPDALQRLGLEWVVPARAGAAPPVAALPALQPALRARLRAPVRAAPRLRWRG